MSLRLKEGDYLILHHGERDRHLLRYRAGFSFGSRRGQVELPEKLHYGDCLFSSSGNPFFVLIPTTAELTMRLKRKTTIIYPKDAGWMVQHTPTRAGSRVLECGSGSGALTILLAGIVGSEGRVISCERREEHLELAKQNVAEYGLEDRVEFHLLDTEREGFPVKDVEAVFIDVPEPWTLVTAARDALTGGGSWASLSPTYNQVERVVEALSINGFTCVETVEILERKLLVRPGKTRPSERNITHTAFLTRARKSNIILPPEEE